MAQQSPVRRPEDEERPERPEDEERPKTFLVINNSVEVDPNVQVSSDGLVAVIFLSFVNEKLSTSIRHLFFDVGIRTASSDLLPIELAQRILEIVDARLGKEQGIVKCALSAAGIEVVIAGIAGLVLGGYKIITDYDKIRKNLPMIISDIKTIRGRIGEIVKSRLQSRANEINSTIAIEMDRVLDEPVQDILIETHHDDERETLGHARELVRLNEHNGPQQTGASDEVDDRTPVRSTPRTPTSSASP